MRLSRFFLAVSAVALLAAPPIARADGLVDEVRLGVYEHDVSLLGHQKEKGEDFGAEFLFASPELLDVIGSPRPIIGGLYNSAGETDQAYIGLTWTWDFWRNVMHSGDGFYLEGTLGGGWNDGEISAKPAQSQTRKSLGSNALFREDVDFGYHITPVWSIALSYNHISDADLAKRNEGLNDLGIRVGMKF